MFDRIAAISAEMPNVIALRDQKIAPRRSRNPRSWQTLSNASPETSNCPAMDCQLEVNRAIYILFESFLLPRILQERAPKSALFECHFASGNGWLCSLSRRSTISFGSACNRSRNAALVQPKPTTFIS